MQVEVIVPDGTFNYVVWREDAKRRGLRVFLRKGYCELWS